MPDSENIHRIEVLVSGGQTMETAGLFLISLACIEVREPFEDFGFLPQKRHVAQRGSSSLSEVCPKLAWDLLSEIFDTIYEFRE